MTNQKIERALEILFSPGEWFQLPYSYLRALTPNEAILLSYMGGKAKRFKAEGDEKFFYLTVNTIKSDLGMSEDSQKRAINKLKDRGLIRMKLMGMPAKRHFKLNYMKMAELIADHDSPSSGDSPDLGQVPKLDRGQVPKLDRGQVPDKVDRKNRKKRKGGGRTSRPAPANGFLSDDWDRQSAAKLREILDRYGADIVQPPKRTNSKTFVKMFTRLRTERKIPKQEVDGLMDWLSDHYDDDYTPDINKADDLATYWKKFTNARRRWEHDNENGQPDSAVEGIPFPSEEKSPEQGVADDVVDFLQEECDDYEWGADPTREQIAEALAETGHDKEKLIRRLLKL